MSLRAIDSSALNTTSTGAGSSAKGEGSSRHAGPATMELAAAEGLEAHRQAVAYRLSSMERS